MKKGLKYGLIGLGALLTIAIISVCVLFFMGIIYVIYGDSHDTPGAVAYHNSVDLYKITNVQFPEVELVDSLVYDSFSLHQVTEKFILKNDKDKELLLARIKEIMPMDSKYWKKTDSDYVYYILPEFPIDRPNGSGWRKTDDGWDDVDGRFIRMEFPINNDTITLQYGWCR